MKCCVAADLPERCMAEIAMHEFARQILKFFLALYKVTALLQYFQIQLMTKITTMPIETMV